MTKPQPRDRMNDALYGGFFLSVLIGVIGGFRNSELIVDIGFWIMVAVGVVYVARRLVLRRRHAQTSQGDSA